MEKLINEKKVVYLVCGKGSFINSYDEDAKVLNYLLDYKINKGYICGFPKSALGKVRSVLESEKISYKIILNSVGAFHEFYNLKNVSKYDEVLKLAINNINKNKLLDEVISLLEKCDEKKINDCLVEIKKCLS